MSKKFSPIWEKIKKENRAEISCSPSDILTITNAVRKLKSRDKRGPENKMLSIETETLEAPSKEGYTMKIVFILRADTSIRGF